MKYRIPIYIISIFLMGLVVSAQATDCPVDVDVALTTANEICLGTGRNQVCYGNNDINAMPYDDVDLNFDAPGDRAELNDIRGLSLSAFDVENDLWGIAVMRLLANLNPSESEDVTVLLFGDVEVEDANGQQKSQIVLANTYANMRRLPDADSPVMDSVAPNEEVQVTGRLDDNTWVRVVNPETNIVGWILAILLNDIDFEALDVVAANEPYFAPMQAFYFQSGTGSADCAAVPRDGMIVQTPEGLRRVTLWVNEVTIDFMSSSGSTASFTTEDDGSMSVNVLEGSVYVGSETGGYVAVTGSSVNVKQDGDSVTVSKPSATSDDVLSSTPLNSLDREIDIPVAASDSMIAEANGFVSTILDDASEELIIDPLLSEDGTVTEETIVTTEEGGGGGGKKNCPGNSCDAPGRDKGNSNNGKKNGKKKGHAGK